MGDIKYETVRGSSIAQLLSDIRKKHGNSVHIIRQQEVKDGGILGTGLLSRKLFEIIYMVKEAPDRVTTPEKKRVSKPEFEKVTRSDLVKKLNAEISRKTLPETIAIPEPDAIDLIAQAQAQLGITQAPHISPAQPRPIASASVLSNSSIDQMRGRLRESRLSERLIETVMGMVRDSMPPIDKDHPGKVEEHTLARLTDLIVTVPDIAPRAGECKAVMLIGPTGTGKTTSIAKLAARYKYFEKRDVSLYSLDRYRLAATQQLKLYADVMKLAFYSPLTDPEFKAFTEQDRSELLLLDTSGISYRDKAKLSELRQTADQCQVRLEKHLVLSANMDPAVLDDIFEAFEVVGFDKILLTKLDESEFIGGFIEYADKFKRPFSFCTNGQEVPHDLISPDAAAMARMVLRKETVGLR